MARTSYTLDGIVIGAEASFGTIATSFNISLGYINSCDINITDEVRQMRHIKGGDDGFLVDRNVDLLHTISGRIETHPIDWKPLQYFLGSYSAPSTTYTINPSRDINSLSLKGNYDGSDALQVLGVVLSKATLELRENEPVIINYDYLAQIESNITESITGTAPSQDPLTFLSGSVSVDGNNYKINTMTLNMDFAVEGKRNIESVSVGKERVITEAIKKNLTCDFSINADLQDSGDEYQVYSGGSTVQSARSDFNIIITMKDANGDTHTATLSGARGTTFNKSYRTTGDIKNFDINGVLKDVQFTGTV